LIAYDCSLKNELLASVNDYAANRDGTLLAQRRAVTYSFHNRYQFIIEMSDAE
jgi:hypothetical protein